MNYVYNCTTKDEFPQMVIRFTNWVKRRYGCQVKFIKTDNESSLSTVDITRPLAQFLDDEGITIEPSPPHNAAPNGAAEQAGYRLVEKGRAARLHANLPESLWPEALRFAAYAKNRTPIKQFEWRSPFEELQHCLDLSPVRPNISHLRAYGCRAYPLIYDIPKLDKMQPRAHIGYLVGYEATNIYRIWIPSEQKVVRTTDVTFNEQLFYEP
jgi:hypothetical protein